MREDFATRFEEHQSTALAHLPQYNLDVGSVEGVEPSYPPAAKTAATLAALAGSPI